MTLGGALKSLYFFVYFGTTKLWMIRYPLVIELFVAIHAL